MYCTLSNSQLDFETLKADRVIEPQKTCLIVLRTARHQNICQNKKIQEVIPSQLIARSWYLDC